MSSSPASGIAAKGEGRGGPSRGYSWPPFEAGNTVALRHGVWSRRTVDPLAEEFVLGLLADRPELARYPEAVMGWARCEARCVLIGEHFADGLLDDEGKERPGLRYVVQFERAAAEARRVLGLDPRSEAELARDRADAIRGEVDLEGLRERGRRARIEAEASA